MAILSVLLVAALSGLSQAAVRPRTDGPLFVPAIQIIDMPDNLMDIAAVDAPAPKVLQLTPEELDAWAVNGTQTLEPPAFTGEAEKREIIGVDERYSRKSKDFPWSAIGKLLAPIGNNKAIVCSGALVGPRLMVAARHCLNENAQYYKFSPGYNHGDVFQTARSTSIVSLAIDNSTGGCDIQNDWALFVLDQPLGTQRGFFKIGSYLDDLAIVSGKPIMYSAGYPGDLDGGDSLYQSDFRTTSLAYRGACPPAGPITGDADTAGGMSGGPLWRLDGNNRVLYGALVGSLMEDDDVTPLYSAHSHGRGLVQGVNQLNSENPK